MPFQVTVSGFTTRPKLSEEFHEVMFYFETNFLDIGVNGVYYSKYVTIDQNAASAYFTIEDGQSSILRILSLENKTYNQNILSLNFAIDELTS
jgi:hypothetical protein